MSKNVSNILTGIDDATKCPCIGSIFVSGVVANKKTVDEWHALGVKDSKLLSPKKRVYLAEFIKKTASAYAIHEVTPAMIDNKQINLNAWEMVVTLKIIQDLQNQQSLQKIYIDNWEVSEHLFYERLRFLIDTQQNILQKHKIHLKADHINSLQFVPEHRADENHTIVGAASILSKVHSDAQYAAYKKEYGDFGSGSPADPKTRLFVWQHRKNPLPIIRKSWQTFKTLVNLESINDDAIYARQKKKNILSSSTN